MTVSQVTHGLIVTLHRLLFKLNFVCCVSANAEGKARYKEKYFHFSPLS